MKPKSYIALLLCFLIFSTSSPFSRANIGMEYFGTGSSFSVGIAVTNNYYYLNQLVTIYYGVYLDNEWMADIVFECDFYHFGSNFYAYGDVDVDTNPEYDIGSDSSFYMDDFYYGSGGASVWLPWGGVIDVMYANPCDTHLMQSSWTWLDASEDGGSTFYLDWSGYAL